MSREETDLATHVEICAIRYQGIEDKFTALESRISKVEVEISSLKSQMNAGFTEIKLLLEKQNTARSIQLIATFGTLVTAILAFAGYVITH